jgi:hypothetical protein
MAHLFLSNNLKQDNSKLLQLLSHKVIYEVYLILEDCHKQLRKIVVNRMTRPSKNKPHITRAQTYDFKARELSAYEELKRPLLQEGTDISGISGTQMIPEGLGSQHINRMILKNTIDIIDESIIAIKYSSSFAVISHEA